MNRSSIAIRLAAPDALGMHRDRQEAAGRVGPGVAELLGPDLEDLRRRRQPVAARVGRRLEVGPVVERPRDRHLDERPLRPEPRPLGDRVAVALADAVEAVVVGHQRRVVGEPGRARSARATPRRATSTAPANPSAAAPVDPLDGRRRSARGSRAPRPAAAVAKSSWNQPWQASSWPPARIASVDVGNVSSVCPGTNQVDGMPRSREQREDPRRADPHAELRVRQLDRRIAAADAVGDRVVVEGQGDGQAGQHRPSAAS